MIYYNLNVFTCFIQSIYFGRREGGGGLNLQKNYNILIVGYKNEIDNNHYRQSIMHFQILEIG